MPLPTTTILVGFVVFLFVFVFWQSLRQLWGKADTVFLDKLCIDQCDADNKKTGILGLAAFLKASDNIVVLWSERYFTRLWCTYELAAWCYLGKSFRDTVTLVPVKATVRFFVLALSNALVIIAYQVLVVFGDVPRLLFPVLWVVLGVPYLSVAAHTYRVLHSEISYMSELLEQYKIDQARCFCCDNDHRHPETGDRLGCDRKLVMRTLADWVLADRDGCDDAVAYFNDFVQRELRGCRDMLLMFTTSIKPAVIISLSIMWLNLPLMVMLLLGFVANGNERQGACAEARLASFYAVDFCQQALSWKLLMYMARRSAPRSGRRPRWIVSSLLGLVVGLVFTISRLLVLRITLSMTGTLSAALSIAVAFLAVWSYCSCPGGCKFKRR
eukprot:TRINITY_DN35666_c0_g1_i2.p1 TRINITY_DN35666_c0_g1~~TRINITY_DN35666_c0_g1_i2.p1  ORF type:complete len:385 (+),score=14.62 TRINITY_DN35666_c0_g1_i2:299-1453(+)